MEQLQQQQGSNFLADSVRDQRQEIKSRAGRRSNFRRNSATAPINLNFSPQRQKLHLHHFQLESVFITLANVLSPSSDVVGFWSSKNFI